MFAACHEDSQEPKNNMPPEKIVSTPGFTLTNLSRGTFMTDGTMEEMHVTIEGEACDSINAITGVTVNGTSVTLAGSDDCKTFSAEVNSIWGLNIIDMIVENALGDEVPLVQSYLRSPEYFPAPGTEDDARIAGAWRGRLGQEVLDDGDPHDLDDLASIMAFAINNFNFDEAMPVLIAIAGDDNDDGQVDLINNNCIWPLDDVTTHKTGYRVAKNGKLNMGLAEMDHLEASNGTLNFLFRVQNISQKIVANAYVNLACVYPNEVVTTTTGKIETGSVEVIGSMKIEIQNRKAIVTLASINSDISGLNVTIDNSGVIDNLISFIASKFNSQIEDLFSNLLLKNYVLPQIEAVLNNISINPTIDLPSPINVQLNVNSDLQDLKVGDRYIDLGFAARVLPSEFKKDASQLGHGSIIGASTLPSFIGMNGTFGLGMKDDFINQVLWAVWAGGGFDLGDGNISLITDLMGSASLDATFVSVETGLPPVLMPGAEGSEVKIGIGDVLVKMKVNPNMLGQPGSGIQVELSFYVSLTLTGTLEINPETRVMNVTLSGEPAVHVQLADHVRTEGSTVLESKIGNFTSDLIQRLVTDVVGAVELPSIPLSKIDGIPAGTNWVLDHGSMDHAAGYFRVIGEVGIE